MRVLFVTSLYLPWMGGLEVLTDQLCAELRERGHEVAVLTAVNDDRVPPGRTLVKDVPVLRTDAYHVVNDRPDLKHLLQQRRDIRRFLEEFAPDVVHAQDAGPVLGAYRQAARKQVPLVVTLHNIMSLLVPESLATIRRTLEGVDLVTGVSRDVVTDAECWAPELAGRLVEIRNGLPGPGTPVAPSPTGPAHFVSVGRLARQKAFERVVEAMEQVVALRPGVRLTIAGEGSERPALIEQVRARGLEESVMLAGRVEREDMAALLASATAVVVPSRFEGLPLVALEAAWAGRPVVATDVPGLRCAVEDEGTGLLVPEHDGSALVRAMVRLADDGDLVARLGGRARRVVEAEWSFSACVDQYLVAYDRVTA